MRIKLDENLGRRAAAILESAGHDVSTAADQRLAGAADELIIQAARDSGRCLLTLDLDFANPLLFHPPDYAGIAVMRLPPKPVADDLFEAVRTFVDGLEREPIGGKLWIVQPGKLRVYQPESEPPPSTP